MNYLCKSFIGAYTGKNREGTGEAWENHKSAMMFDPYAGEGKAGRKESGRLRYSSKNVWTSLEKRSIVLSLRL